MTLLHTYIGHDLISRTVSLHTYSLRSKIYCNVLIKLYHTTAHHRKEKICHQKNQSIFFVCSRRLKTISRILILIPEKKNPTFILIKYNTQGLGIYQVYPFLFLGVQCIKKHGTAGYGYIC